MVLRSDLTNLVYPPAKQSDFGDRMSVAIERLETWTHSKVPMNGITIVVIGKHCRGVIRIGDVLYREK